jgi:predicted small secreted protein
MRRNILIALAAVASTLASCASMRIGDIRVYGWALNRVTRADIEAAIRADEAEQKRNSPHNDPISEVDVVSRDEIHIYHGPRVEGVWFHCIIKRVNGKWRYTGEAIYTS